MDLYIVLGLAHGATEADIKRAYRRLARRFHPDINPGDRVAEARFRQILDAYETLMDPLRRSRYDAGQGLESSEQRPKSGFEGFDFSTSGGDHSVTFGDLFAEVLSERGGRVTTHERGADLHQNLRLSFEDSLAGGERILTVTRRENCRVCAGTGQTRATSGPCHVCQGNGAVRSVRGHMVFTRSCPDCGGRGLQARPCPSCSGQGRQLQSEWLSVQIPAGVASGSRVRVPGAGNAGQRGGRAGDFVLKIDVEPHPLYERDGADLVCELPVSLAEAAAGAHVPVPTPDGPVTIEIPAGTQPGQRFRLRKRGMPKPGERGRGDLWVKIRLVVPAVTDERARALLRELARLHPEDPRRDLPLRAAKG